MAAKLEEAVGKREKNRLVQKLLEETSEINEETEEDILKPLVCTHGGAIEGIGELTGTCREFFNNVNSALWDDDLPRCFQFLQHARSIGRELVNR